MIQGVSNISAGINASVSGINAGRFLQTISAGNVANVFSEDFEATRVTLTSVETGGVEANLSIDHTPPVQVPNGDGTFTNLSNVNLTDEIMNFKLGEDMVNANAAVYKVQSETIGTIIDLLA